MTRRPILLLLVSLWSASAAGAPRPGADGSWPCWQGPNGDGVSTENDWSTEGRELWSRNVGLGYSNVVIDRGRLFTAGFDEEAQLDRILCLDPATGEVLWINEQPAEIRDNFHGGGTLCTPTIDGERLYVTDRVGRTRCLRTASGEPIWERDYTSELELKVTFHGFSAAPLVQGDALVLGLGGTLVKVDKADGALIWKTSDHGDGSHSHPVPFTLGDRSCLVYFSGDSLMLVDAESGEELPAFPWKPTGGGVNAATPIVMGERIFITSAYDMGCALLDYASGAPEPVWRNKRMRNKVSGCVLYEEHIYGFDESMLKCIDLEGRERWRVRGLGMGALALAGDRLLVLSSGGELLIGKATPEGFEELSRTQPLQGGVYWTAPVLLDGLLYCRNSLGDLVCLDHRAATGTPLASAAHDEPEVATAALPEARALFAAHLEAIGGEAALRAHRSIHVAGTVEILGAGITRTAMTIDRLAPDRHLLTYDLGEYGTVRRGFDGTVGWQLDPFYGNEVRSGGALRELELTSGLHADADFATLYSSMTTVGRGTFDGRDCWTVEATVSDGATRTLYFEVESGLLAGRDAETESLVRFTDYARFSDLSLPTLTTVLIPETGAEETFRIDSVDFDGVQPELFELPEEVVLLMRSPEEVEAADEALRARHADLVGTYVGDIGDTPDVPIEIRVEGGRLVAVPPEQDPLPLAPPTEDSDPDRWPLVSTDTVFILFLRNDDGAVRGLQLNVRGEASELVRQDG